MLTRFIRNQLIVFGALTLAATVALCWFYLKLPSQLGIGQYQLIAELPASGGLYRTSNVTYRGIQIGRVIKVVPTQHGGAGHPEHRQPLQDSRRRLRQRALGVRRG